MSRCREETFEYKSCRLVTCITVDYTEAERHECHTKYHRQCTNARNVTAQIALECGYSGLPALLPIRICIVARCAFSNFPLISISPTRGTSEFRFSFFLFFFYFSPRCTHARVIRLLTKSNTRSKTLNFTNNYHTIVISQCRVNIFSKCGLPY